MSQREAFEAHIKNTWAEISPAELDVAQEAWQAAIQHARDVAVKACEDERIAADKKLHSDASDEYFTGRSACAVACADAIKEALK